MSSINQAVVSQASVILPKWIDDKRGSDPLVDDLIAYIEKNAACQVVTDERAALEDARNAAYPVPDSPHASVNLRAVAERTGFTRGWQAHAALAAAPVQAGHFPQRDKSKPAEQQGVFQKFYVRRTDGSSAPGGKHHGCRYFVLDVDHDVLAKPALQAYAAACAATHPDLSADMAKRFDLAPVPPVAVPDGWKLVPPEPNDAMQAAGAQAIRIDTTAINKIWTGNAVFRAMIAAAPAAPATQGAAKDTERLRWLVETGARISWSMDGEYCAVWLPDERDGTESRPAEGYPLKCYDSWHRAIDAAITADKEDT